MRYYEVLCESNNFPPPPLDNQLPSCSTPTSVTPPLSKKKPFRPLGIGIEVEGGGWAREGGRDKNKWGAETKHQKNMVPRRTVPRAPETPDRDPETESQRLYLKSRRRGNHGDRKLRSPGWRSETWRGEHSQEEGHTVVIGLEAVGLGGGAAGEPHGGRHRQRHKGPGDRGAEGGWRGWIGFASGLR